MKANNKNNKNKKNIKKATIKKIIPKKNIKKTIITKSKKPIIKSKISLSKPKLKLKSKPKFKPIKSKKEIIKQTKTKIKIKSMQIKKTQAKPSNIKKQAVLGPIDIKPYDLGKNEEYMNKKQITHFRNILANWKEQLMEDVDRTMHHMQDEASNYPDPVDRASQEEEFNLELRTRDRERKLLKKIEDTLMRINDQDYGYCDDCGAEIGIRRLEARPTATQCIECKTISEIREKQVGENT
jgi:DnaK suppressor protein